MTSIPFYLMITFWGDRFREDFYSLCLSSLLSPNNIPHLRDMPGCKFLISTSKKDWDALQGRPLFEKMREYLEPVLIDIGFPEENKSLAPAITGKQRVMLHMSAGHRLAARKALEDRVWAGFVAPDVLVSDGTLAFILGKASEGKRCVLAPIFRYSTEPVIESLQKDRLLVPNKCMTLGARYLARLAQRSLHSEIQRYEFEAPYFGDDPLWCYWRVPGRDALVIHSVSWGLVMADFRNLKTYDDRVLEQDTTDGKYIYETFYQENRKEDLYLATDSDDIFFLSLTPESELTYLPFQRRPINETIGGEQNRVYGINRALFSPMCDEFRRWAYQAPCHVHGDDLTESSIQTAKQSSAIVERAVKMGTIERFRHSLFIDDFHTGVANLETYPSGITGRLCLLVIRSKLQELVQIFTGKPQIDAAKAARLQAQAETMRAEGKLAGAIKLYSDSIRVSPPNTALYFRRGTAYLERRRPRAAVRDFKQALKLDPTNAVLRSVLDQARNLFIAARIRRFILKRVRSFQKAN
jgi:hypothetical protein